MRGAIAYFLSKSVSCTIVPVWRTSSTLSEVQHDTYIVTFQPGQLKIPTRDDLYVYIKGGVFQDHVLFVNTDDDDRVVSRGRPAGVHRCPKAITGRPACR
jgi:hypothetical protein